MKAYLLVAGAVLAISTPVAAQDFLRLPAGSRIEPAAGPGNISTYQPRGGFVVRDAPCHVDPAIGAVTLTKGAGGDVSVTYEVLNRGRQAWASGPNQQQVTVRVTNANTGRSFRETQLLAGAAAPRASMGRFSTPMIRNAFDDFEFGGDVEVQIGYDPDIFIDGNRCNDDAAQANNVLRISNAQVASFLGSTARSRTFR